MEFTELQQIVESTAKSVQALSDDVATMRLNIDAFASNVDTFVTETRESFRLAAEERAELRRATTGIANLLSSLDQDRPTILRKLNTIENKLDRVIDKQNEQQ